MHRVLEQHGRRITCGITIIGLAFGLGIPQRAIGSDDPVTRAGASKALGAGTASSWVTVDANGAPLSIGITISDAAVLNPGAEAEVPLPLPAVAGLPFKTAVVDWHPHGHEPPHVYDVPHFDFHFYIIDEATRMKVGSQSPKPDERLVPAGYITDGSTVPMMGMHYVPSAAPEFHGQPFTQTLIYGYTDGAMAFIEPMVTQKFLLESPGVDAMITQPAAFDTHGLYPTRYRISHDTGQHAYTIELTDLVQR